MCSGSSLNFLRIYELVCIFVFHGVCQLILSTVVGHGILICLPFLKPFVLLRAKRSDGNIVNNAKEEEKKRDSLGG
jgi:hypothetical protein